MKRVTITLPEDKLSALDMYVAHRKQSVPSYKRTDAVYEATVNVLATYKETLREESAPNDTRPVASFDGDIYTTIDDSDIDELKRKYTSNI